jgi:hypothetical protein
MGSVSTNGGPARPEEARISGAAQSELSRGERRTTYLLRRALGDLFLGPYYPYFGLQVPGSTLPSDGPFLG